MKYFYTVSMLLISSLLLGQDFKTNVDYVRSFTSPHKFEAKFVAINNQNQLIHGREEVEVVDLASKKVVYTWNPKGGYGETWIEPNGRFVANYGQNAKNPEGKSVNIFQVLDLTTKKVYPKFTPDESWDKGAFGKSNSEMLIKPYNSKRSEVRAELYDFKSGKAIKKYFSSTKFSTVVMTMAFSKDDSQVYLVIAENSINSYINIYDKNTATLVKKIPLSYQADKIFAVGEFIFVSGAHGNTGQGYTSKFNAKDYSKKGEWKFRIYNTDPMGNYSILQDYKTNIVYKYDLTTGTKSELFKTSEKMVHTGGMTSDTKYFFNAIKRKGDHTKHKGTESILVFKNDLISDIAEVDHVKEPEPVKPWVYHKSIKPSFILSFPSRPTVKTGETEKGKHKQTVKHTEDKKHIYIITSIELPGSISKSKYNSLAEKTANAFLKSMGAESSGQKTFDFDDVKGVEHNFTLKGSKYRYWSICIKSVSYQLIYLNSSGDGEVGDKFFNSFKVKD